MPLGIYALMLTAGFAAGLLGWLFLTSLREVHEEVEEQLEVYSSSPLFKVVYPFAQHFGRVLGPIRLLDGFRKVVASKLLFAGKSLAITADDFLGLMVVCGVGGLGVGLYFHLLAGIQPLTVVVMALFVSLLPFLQLSEQVTRRQKAILKILPYALDLLCLAVEAGMDFTAALSRIGENLKKSPLQEELRMLSRDLSMGKTRAEGLRDMEYRIGLEELTAVVSALVQADELGASLGPALRIQSQELQRKRFQRAEKKALQAPVLMLIPLVLFIFPLVFLIIFTPIVLRAMEQF